MLPIKWYSARFLLLWCVFAVGCSQTLAPMNQRTLPGQSKQVKTHAIQKTKPTNNKKTVRRLKRRIIKAPSHHIVKSGDTLHAIAWRYGLRFKSIAKWNNLRSPYVIKKGQLLALRAVKNRRAPTNISRNKVAMVKPAVVVKPPTVVNQPSKTRKSLKVFWDWPTQGEVIQGFNKKSARKGLDIAGQEGQPIVAAADGEVVYSNNNLRGYGNLVIIKHSDDLLSAYAYNKTLVVTERDRIRKGQQIATMGTTGDKAILHFEIRKYGEPVNPLRFLPDR